MAEACQAGVSASRAQNLARQEDIGGGFEAVAAGTRGYALGAMPRGSAPGVGEDAVSSLFAS